MAALVGDFGHQLLNADHQLGARHAYGQGRFDPRQNLIVNEVGGGRLVRRCRRGWRADAQRRDGRLALVRTPQAHRLKILFQRVGISSAAPPESWSESADMPSRMAWVAWEVLVPRAAALMIARSQRIQTSGCGIIRRRSLSGSSPSAPYF